MNADTEPKRFWKNFVKRYQFLLNLNRILYRREIWHELNEEALTIFEAKLYLNWCSEYMAMTNYDLDHVSSSGKYWKINLESTDFSFQFTLKFRADLSFK